MITGISPNGGNVTVFALYLFFFSVLFLYSFQVYDLIQKCTASAKAMFKIQMLEHFVQSDHVETRLVICRIGKLIPFFIANHIPLCSVYIG